MEYIVSFEDGSEGYLAHHGIKGQKWGVRTKGYVKKGLRNVGGAKSSQNPSKTSFRAARQQKKIDKYAAKVRRNKDKAAAVDAKIKARKSSLVNRYLSSELGKRADYWSSHNSEFNQHVTKKGRQIRERFSDDITKVKDRKDFVDNGMFWEQNAKRKYNRRAAKAQTKLNRARASKRTMR